MAYGGGETPQMALDRAIKAGVVEARRDSTFYCNVCEKALKSKDTIKAHLRTNVHSKNSIDYDCAPRRKTVQQQKAMPREPSGKSTSARSLQDISKDSVTSDDLERAIRLGVVIEPKRPGDSYYCSSCEKPLKTKQTMRAHLSTPTHLSEIQKVMPKEPSGKSTSVRSLQATPKGSTTSDDLERAIRLRVVFEPDSPGDSYYCSSCEKHLKTKQTMRAHLSTPTHLSKTDVRTAIPQFLSSPGPQKQKHGSSRHYDRANPVEKAFADGILVDEGAGKDSKGPFWCSVCNQTLKTFGKLSAHLSSKKHNGKLVKKNLCAGGKDDQRCNGETSDSSGSDSCGSESYSSSPSDSDSCDDDEDDEDERLVSKALRDGILQDDTLTHPMSPYWCKVCLLSLRQYRRLAGHLRSNKHRAKDARMPEVTRAGIRGQAGSDSITLLRDVSSSGIGNQTFEIKGVFSFHFTNQEHSQQANTTTLSPSAEGSNQNLTKTENIKDELLYDKKHWQAGVMKANCEDGPERPDERAFGQDSSFPPKFLSIKKESDEPTEASDSCHPADSEEENEGKLVFFDLETGGLEEGADILQIAAVHNSQQFMRYVTPTKPVNPKAQKVNGLKNNNGVLERRVSENPDRWEKVPTQPMIHTLLEFLEWLNSIGPCYLVAHNVSFDKRHLLYHTRESNLLTRLRKIVLGFIDTCQFFKKLYPGLKKPHGQGHSQTALVEQILGETYDAHDALADVLALQKLIRSTHADPQALFQCMKTF
ncbi:uncharacterized protein LOC135205712 isoform X3 [Macrobrachium nipponense]|uniref:uncharacterized protein LOC135205712 isoform X3 n=1 Tax=Macrobrachium nipponense TaxID=159736 RepID=UPI0030C7D776